MPYRTREEKNAQAALYRASNRARLRERSADYRAANPDAVKAGIRRWEAGRIESVRASARQRYHANREVRQAQHRAWEAEHPVRVAAHAAATSANQRSNRKGLPGRLVADDLEALWLRQPECIDCGIPCRGVDHIVELADGGPNQPDNLANRCLSCNVRKSNQARAARKLVGL